MGKTYDSDQIPGVTVKTGGTAQGSFTFSSRNYPVLERFVCKGCQNIFDHHEPIDLAKIPSNAVRVQCEQCGTVTEWHGKPDGELEGRIAQ